MDERDCLARYPFVVVRIACRVCSRRGSYRLTRLAAKYGPEISLREFTEKMQMSPCAPRVFRLQIHLPTRARTDRRFCGRPGATVDVLKNQRNEVTASGCPQRTKGWVGHP